MAGASGRLADYAGQSLLTLLQTNLNTEITNVKNEYNDGLVMPTVAANNFYYGPKHNLPEFPSCIVWHLPLLSRLEPQGYGNTWAVVNHHWVVQIATTTELEKSLNTVMLRYGEAIFNLLYKNQNLAAPANTNSAVISVMPMEMARGVVENHKPQVLLQSVAWRCEIRVQEQY